MTDITDQDRSAAIAWAKNWQGDQDDDTSAAARRMVWRRRQAAVRPDYPVAAQSAATEINTAAGAAQSAQAAKPVGADQAVVHDISRYCKHDSAAARV